MRLISSSEHMMDSKLTAELTYQRDRALQMRSVSATDSHVMARYRAHRMWRFFNKEFIFKSLGNLQGKTVLDFGCGEGQLGVQMALLERGSSALTFRPT